MLSPLTQEQAEPVMAVAAGATVVWLCDENQVLAAFELSDELRPDALEMIEKLKSQGLSVSIMSGDSDAAVRHIAARLGITDYRGALHPEDKLSALKALQADGAVVAMVGDGVNDAPVLAGADVSLAMGGGTQVARASSDIVLLSEKLPDIWRALQAGRATLIVMRQNFAWAAGYNFLALPFAAMGYIPPWLVVLNALRLRQV
jgi:Cu2+-exporting ATPase